MAAESKSFVSHGSMGSLRKPAQQFVHARASRLTTFLEIAVVFGFILAAVWTPQGRFTNLVNLVAALAVVALTLPGRYSARELGLTRPSSGTGMTLAAGALLVLVVAVAGIFSGSLGPPQSFPWHRAWQYAIWALVQEFILQSVFYVRLESVFGSARAVCCAALLFAIAHVPSPLLTALSFLGGLLFCELFRRYRNIYSLGVVHAALGLTIAARLPDNLLHHMRVGIGYLTYPR